MIDVERLAEARRRGPRTPEGRALLERLGDRGGYGLTIWIDRILAIEEQARDVPPLRFQGDPLYGNAKLLTEGWKSTEQETGVYLLERA